MYAMGGKTFDLTDAILDLLRRIDEGRKTVSETQNVKDRCMSTFADRDKAGQLVKELQSQMASLDDLAKSQAKAELDRQISEFQKLNDDASSHWREFIETIAFLGPFSRDISLLLERLPLTPEWDAYRQAVECLNMTDRDSWTDPPANGAVETLEMRLREMLDLAIRTERGQVRRFDPFPTPNGALWKDVSITFISEHRVQIAVLSVTHARNYAEMGFEDRRGGGGKPDSAWELLKLIAEAGGKIEKPIDFKRPGWSKVEKQAQAIRAGLKKLFSIPGDPLPFRRHGYETEFHIKLGDSIEY